MWQIRSRKSAVRDNALILFFGAAGGLAAGLLLARRSRPAIRADRWAPTAPSRPEWPSAPAPADRALETLEDAVLDLFRADEVLGARPIDVGALSRGIVELSGSVRTPEEAERAVATARRAAGVNTVVNRMEIDAEARHQAEVRRRSQNGDASMSERQHQGMQSGMGATRQGTQTEPDRPDDSQPMREHALEEADREQFGNEGFHKYPRVADRETPLAENPTGFSEDELDNQLPHGGRPNEAEATGVPGAHSSADHVGEPPKPGVELRLEEAGLDRDVEP